MPYAKLLNQLIEQSGMTAKEVAEQCTAQGVSVTPSYLSVLRKEGSNRMPSDEVSKALALVLGQDENLLTLERTLDEAPEPLRKMLQRSAVEATLLVLRGSNQPITDVVYSNIWKTAKESCFANSIVMAANAPTSYENEKQSTFSNVTQEENGNITVNLSAIPEFKVNDNAMYPLVKQGDSIKVTPQAEYNTGDIIAFKNNTSQEIACRQVQRVGDTLLLIAFNSEFAPLQYQESDMKILGKVVATTTLL